MLNRSNPVRGRWHVREAMRQDGAALCEFFAEFGRRLDNGEAFGRARCCLMLIEVQPTARLSPQAFRRLRVSMRMAHYRIIERRHRSLGIWMWGAGAVCLLIDSGGQYQNRHHRHYSCGRYWAG
jgi:Xaa-Pro aminopeptidase